MGHRVKGQGFHRTTTIGLTTIRKVQVKAIPKAGKAKEKATVLGQAKEVRKVSGRQTGYRKV